MSKTKEAIRLATEDGVTPYAAAKRMGLNPHGVYAAMKRLKAASKKAHCPVCDSLVPLSKMDLSKIP
jgi:predicted DNA-binding protein (UPF0251 family)